MNYSADLQPPVAEDTPKAADIMIRKHPTLTPEMNTTDAMKLFLRTGVTGAPVVGEHEQLLGIFTEKDCLKLLAKRSYYHEEPERHVRDDMATGIKTVGPETDVYRIVDIFLANPFRQLPVVDGNGRLMGMISRRDLLEVVQKLTKR